MSMQQYYKKEIKPQNFLFQYQNNNMYSKPQQRVKNAKLELQVKKQKYLTKDLKQDNLLTILKIPKE